jgi:hypothetical protein
VSISATAGWGEREGDWPPIRRTGILRTRMATRG